MSMGVVFPLTTAICEYATQLWLSSHVVVFPLNGAGEDFPYHMLEMECRLGDVHARKVLSLGLRSVSPSTQIPSQSQILWDP